MLKRAYCTAAAALLCAAAAAPAEPPASDADADAQELRTTVNVLKMRLREQERRLSQLEHARQQQEQIQKENILHVLQEMQVDAGARDNDFRVYWDNGLRMATADKRFKLKLGGRLMADMGWIDGSGIEDDLGVDLQDGWEIRRARLYASGTIYEHIGYKVQFDFAGNEVTIKDAYLRLKDVPIFGTLTGGHFKEPFSLEELTSSKYITFLERALPTVFAPSRNLGVMANNTAFGERMTWAVGLFRDTAEDEAVHDGGYNLTARVTGAPWYEDDGRRVLHVGGSYSLRHPEETVRYRQRPEAHFTERFTDTGSFVADWVHLYGAEAALVYGPFSLQGEIIAADADDAPGAGDPTMCGWYVMASYFLTGEHRPYDTGDGTFGRVKPHRNYREGDGWGAFELAARYSQLDMDDALLPDTARQMHNATVGLNWYLNPNVRIMWNYIRSCVDGADVSNAADIAMMRMQVDF